MLNPALSSARETAASLRDDLLAITAGLEHAHDAGDLSLGPPQPVHRGLHGVVLELNVSPDWSRS
jgi:hypothetical protein